MSNFSALKKMDTRKQKGAMLGFLNTFDLFECDVMFEQYCVCVSCFVSLIFMVLLWVLLYHGLVDWVHTTKSTKFYAKQNLILVQ